MTDEVTIYTKGKRPRTVTRTEAEKMGIKLPNVGASEKPAKAEKKTKDE